MEHFEKWKVFYNAGKQQVINALQSDAGYEVYKELGIMINGFDPNHYLKQRNTKYVTFPSSYVGLE